MTVERDERSADNRGSRKLFRFQVQGPHALKVIEKVTGKRTKYFGLQNYAAQIEAMRSEEEDPEVYELRNRMRLQIEQEGRDRIHALAARRRAERRGEDVDSDDDWNEEDYDVAVEYRR